MVKKDYYFVRLPPLENPPVGDYNEKVGVKIISTMAGSKNRAVGNIISRKFNHLNKVILDYLRNQFGELEQFSVNADLLFENISLVDEHGRKVKTDEDSKLYFLANELGRYFRTTLKTAISLAEEYVNFRKHHQ
jgi:hypothetical protein